LRLGTHITLTNENKNNYLWGYDNTNGNGNGYRHLLTSLTSRFLNSEFVSLSSTSSIFDLDGGQQRQTSNNSNSNTKKKYIAKQCPCDPDGLTYCLLDGISGAVPDSCGAPWSEVFLTSNTTLANLSSYDTDDIGCFELNSQTVFIRNAWPVVVLWYGALFIFLLATSNGRYARAYATHVLCPRWGTNERYVDAILARETEMRRRLRAAALRAYTVDGGGAPGRYYVRTRGVRLRDGGDWRTRRRRSSSGGGSGAAGGSGNGGADGNGGGMTEEEERREATRWWIRQAEQLGILSSDGSSDELMGSPSSNSQQHRRMEYVLRTKTFCAEKERARREEMRIRRMKEREGKAGKDVRIPNRDGSVASTSETVDTSLNDSREEGEEQSPASAADTSTPSNGAVQSNPLPPSPSSTPPPPPPQNNNLYSDDDDAEDTFECTICLAEIENGDRVGVLPCTHIFHVDCLQQWITRKNACPLCQVTEIATPRPVVDTNASSPSSSSTMEEYPLEDLEWGYGGGSFGVDYGEERRDRFFFPPSSSSLGRSSEEAEAVRSSSEEDRDVVEGGVAVGHIDSNAETATTTSETQAAATTTTTPSVTAPTTRQTNALRQWFMPTFFFPSNSENSTRRGRGTLSPPSSSRLELSPSPSLSDTNNDDSPLSQDAGRRRRRDRSARQQRRRQRERVLGMRRI